MTISNNNMLPVRQLNSSTPAAGMMPAKVEVTSVNFEKHDLSSDQEAFWALYNQQLDVTLGNQPGLEQSLTGADFLSLLNQQLDVPVELPSNVDGPMSEAEFWSMLNQQLSELGIDLKVDNKLAGGGNLPLDRQLDSAVLVRGISVAPQAVSQKSIDSSVTAVAITQADVDFEATQESRQLGLRNADVIINPEKVAETNVDRLQFKQAMAEQALTPPKEVLSAINPQPVQSSPVATSVLTGQPLPAGLQTMQLTPHSPASQWGDALGERVSFLINQKLNSAEIRIDPPHLGKLDIQIQLKDDAATIVIHTQQAQTRDLIESASARLREFLQESGYSSVDVDVSHQEQSTQQGELAQQGNGENDAEPDLHQSTSEQDAGSEFVSISLTNDGRIDFFA